MAVNRHLGLYQTGNSAIRSADRARTKHGVDRTDGVAYAVARKNEHMNRNRRAATQFDVGYVTLAMSTSVLVN